MDEETRDPREESYYDYEEEVPTEVSDAPDDDRME